MKLPGVARGVAPTSTLCCGVRNMPTASQTSTVCLNPANLFPTALTHQLPRAPPDYSTSTSPRGTPCIGSSGAGAGRGSPPRTPCTCSSGAGAGRGSPPRHLPRFTPRSALSAPGPQSRDRLGGRPTSRPRPAFPRCLLRPDAMVQTQALGGQVVVTACRHRE